MNIRRQPSVNADIIGKHTTGDTVNISAKTSNGWYRVNYPTIGTGYISSTYVSATEPVQEQPVISKPIEEPVDSTPDSWAKDAVNNAMSMGILFGDDTGNLKLHKDCTRQQ